MDEDTVGADGQKTLTKKIESKQFTFIPRILQLDDLRPAMNTQKVVEHHDRGSPFSPHRRILVVEFNFFLSDSVTGHLESGIASPDHQLPGVCE
jgi:hypothetical protein